MSIEQLGDYDAFVMGRVTYEKFYANWVHIAGNPNIDLVSAMPKYVAAARTSCSLSPTSMPGSECCLSFSPQWADQSLARPCDIIDGFERRPVALPKPDRYSFQTLTA